MVPATPPEPAHDDLERGHLTAEEAMRPFDLTTGPVLRVTHLQLAAEDQIILFTTHHIASDVWSMGVLVKELMALYSAFVEGRPSPGQQPSFDRLRMRWVKWAGKCSSQ